MDLIFQHYHLLVDLAHVEKILQVIFFIHLFYALTVTINKHIHIIKLQVSFLTHA